MSTATQQQVGGFTVAPASDNIIADPGTNLKPRTADDLDPRMTRWGIAAIWDMLELPAQGFLTWEIPGGVFRAFNLFQFPTTNEKGRTQLVDRFPSDQVQDLVNINPYFIEFQDVAKLQDGAAALSIFSALANPDACTKYPFTLKTKCGTCWLNYLRSSKASERLSQFVNTQYEEIVTSAYVALTTLLERSITEAERQVDEAEALIADDSSSKSTYVPNDIVNIQHTHNEMPEYRRTGGIGKGFTDNLAAALKQAGVGGQATVSVPTEFAQEFLEMKTRLEKLEAEQEKTTPEETPAAASAVVDEEQEVELGLEPDPIVPEEKPKKDPPKK